MKYLFGPLSSAFFNDSEAHAPRRCGTSPDGQYRSISKQHLHRYNSTGVVDRTLPLPAFAIVQFGQVARLLPCPRHGSQNCIGKDSIRKLTLGRAPDILIKPIPKRSAQILSFPQGNKSYDKRARWPENMSPTATNFLLTGSLGFTLLGFGILTGRT
jgi:hypothetical protein